jgi:hypothetical protein
MKQFNDLEFIPHPMAVGLVGVISRIMFENGFGASVVKHQYSYGGDRGLYEVGVLDSNGELHYDNPVANGDVIGYLRPEDVTDVMVKIQQLPKKDNNDRYQEDGYFEN